MKRERIVRENGVSSARLKSAASALADGDDSGIKDPSWTATALFLISLVVTAVALRPGLASAVAHQAAWGAGLGLALLFVVEIGNGWRQCFRADLLMLFGIYFLTLFEFLFDQPKIDGLISGQTATNAVFACFVGYAGLVLGRHCEIPIHQGLVGMLRQVAPSSLVFLILFFSFVGGFFYMASVVSFNPRRFLDAVMAPRFSQPWSRGMFGDWKALLYETSMLLYLVTPLAGVILGRYRKYSIWQIAVTVAMLLFTLFYGFSTGVRNVFGIYVLGCFAGYVFTLGRHERWKPLFAGLFTAAFLLIAMPIIFNFRDIGLGEYIAANGKVGDLDQKSEVFVDYNLWAIGVITDHFPSEKKYLLLEIPYITLIRPIPRAMWPGKPEGLSVDPAELAGIGGEMTMAATFIGEAYMSLGIFGVFLGGLGFGMFGRWWVRQAGTYNSDWSALIYASGMFTVSIALRSSMQFTTAVLPTLFLLLLIHWLAPKQNQRRVV